MKDCPDIRSNASPRSQSFVGQSFVGNPREAGRSDAELMKCAINGTNIAAPEDLHVATGDNTSAHPALSGVTAKTHATTEQLALTIAVRTSLRDDRFRRYLQYHQELKLVSVILYKIRFGAEIGYLGPAHTFFSNNAVSAKLTALSWRKKKEFSLQHTTGPFPRSPFQNFMIHFLGVVPKKNGVHRIIMDTSMPGGSSVNSFISAEQCSLSLCSLDNAGWSLLTSEKNALMTKLRIKYAFRLVAVKPAYWYLLGYHFFNRYYFDTVLSHGSRSSPYLIYLFSDAIC